MALSGWPWDTTGKPYILTDQQAKVLQQFVEQDIKDTLQEIEDYKGERSVCHGRVRWTELNAMIGASSKRVDFMRQTLIAIGGAV